MREVLDCAVLLVPHYETAVLDWLNAYNGKLGRLRLEPYLLQPESATHTTNVPVTAVADTMLLARAALQLRRFDVCLLFVEPAILAWARTALACSRALLQTPLLGVLRDLKAAAVYDLYSLGMADFIRDPACIEEMRARIMRLGASLRGLLPPDLSAEVGEPSMTYMQRPQPYAASQPPRSRLPKEQIDQVLLAMRAIGRAQTHEPFRKAKARVVEGFEREYLRHALARHGGNVAQAARASDKHRRAFWALMRKHQIDASPYRNWARAEDGRL